MSEKTAKNDVTGDLIKSKHSSQKYYDNYDQIFRKPKENQNDKTDTVTTASTTK